MLRCRPITSKGEGVIALSIINNCLTPPVFTGCNLTEVWGGGGGGGEGAHPKPLLPISLKKEPKKKTNKQAFL